jgi:hypothetical protein
MQITRANVGSLILKISFLAPYVLGTVCLIMARVLLIGWMAFDGILLLLLTTGAVLWVFGNKQTLKKRLYIFSFLLLLLLVSLFKFDSFFPPDFYDCNRYTEKLNGGVKEFGGRKYTISMCGDGPIGLEGHDILLKVFSENGHLLAMRNFIAVFDSSPVTELKYEPNRITYYDAYDNGVEQQISMPPTALDWIIARLPAPAYDSAIDRHQSIFLIYYLTISLLGLIFWFLKAFFQMNKR